MINRKHGFTLIEIIIVISIMTLFLGAGFVSYNSFGQQKQLEQDAEMLRDRLSIIRERTVDRDITTNSNCAQFNGFRLRIDLPAGNFLTYFRCGQPPTITETAIASENFSLNSARIAFPTVDRDYLFLYPYGCDTADCSTNRVNSLIRLRNQNNTQCMDVNIDKLGNTSFTRPYNGPC